VAFFFGVFGELLAKGHGWMEKTFAMHSGSEYGIPVQNTSMMASGVRKHLRSAWWGREDVGAIAVTRHAVTTRSPATSRMIRLVPKAVLEVDFTMWRPYLALQSV
jgi:hypothetical protein